MPIKTWHSASDRLDERGVHRFDGLECREGVPLVDGTRDAAGPRRFPKGMAHIPTLAAHPAATQAQRRRGGRVVEGARLESVYTGNRIAGSNPALSATSFSLL